MRAVKFVTLLALALAGCGGGDDSAPPDTSADRAFAARMIPHHEAGVEMAQVAVRRGESAFVRRLARDIVATRTAEIATLRREQASLPRGSVDVPRHDSGLGPLRRAARFDPVFLRAMIAHHEDALEMARAERAEGTDAELRRLATSIIDTQQAEIARMREHLGAGGAGDHHNP